MTGINQGFPQQSRLKKAAEFKKVFTNPVKSTDRYFTVLATQNDFGFPRIGLAIAKKIIRKAVDRNVIKRTVRESFRLQQHNIGNIDIVVLARKEALAVAPSELTGSLERHWLKLVSKCVTC